MRHSPWVGAQSFHADNPKPLSSTSPLESMAPNVCMTPRRYNSETFFLLDILARQRAAMPKLLAFETQSMLVQWGALFGDGSSLSHCRCQAPRSPATSAFLLDVVTRHRAFMHELLTFETQTLLVSGCTPCPGFHIGGGVGRLTIEHKGTCTRLGEDLAGAGCFPSGCRNPTTCCCPRVACLQNTSDADLAGSPTCRDLRFHVADAVGRRDVGHTTPVHVSTKICVQRLHTSCSGRVVTTWRTRAATVVGSPAKNLLPRVNNNN